VEKLTILVRGAVFLGLCVTASADILNLFPPPPPLNISSEGQDIGNFGVGVLFDAVNTFSINDAAIQFNPLFDPITEPNLGKTLNIQSVIYSVTGGTETLTLGADIAGTNAPSGLANSAITPVVGLDQEFYDTLINFTFVAGNRYAIEFFANDDQAGTLQGWGTGANDTERNLMTLWEYDPAMVGYSAFTVGPSGSLGAATVIDGVYVGDGGPGNRNFPAIQLSSVAVPEPSTILLFGSAALLLFERSRNRNR
jgi:hypothetical protein